MRVLSWAGEAALAVLAVAMYGWILVDFFGFVGLWTPPWW